MVWYSHLFQNFPQFIVIHTVKGFGIVNKAEIEIFLELSCFFGDPADVGNLIQNIILGYKEKLELIFTCIFILVSSKLFCVFTAHGQRLVHVLSRSVMSDSL